MLSAGEENRIGYFGEQRDKESDYFAMGFRLYDPEIGRFLAIDPLLDVQPSQTPYHYCFNNPTSFTDPTGLYPKKEKGDKVQAMEVDIPSDPTYWTILAYSSDFHINRFCNDVAFGVYEWWGFKKRSDGSIVAGFYSYSCRTGRLGFDARESNEFNQNTAKGIAFFINGVFVAGTPYERQRIIEGLSEFTNSNIHTVDLGDLTYILGFTPNADGVFTEEAIKAFNNARGRLNDLLNCETVTCFLFQDAKELAIIYKQYDPDYKHNVCVGLSYSAPITGLKCIAIANDFVYNNETRAFNKWTDVCGNRRNFTFMETLLHEFGHRTDEIRVGFFAYYYIYPSYWREHLAIQFSNQFFFNQCLRNSLP